MKVKLLALLYVVYLFEIWTDGIVVSAAAVTSVGTKVTSVYKRPTTVVINGTTMLQPTNAHNSRVTKEPAVIARVVDAGRTIGRPSRSTTISTSFDRTTTRIMRATLATMRKKPSQQLRNQTRHDTLVTASKNNSALSYYNYPFNQYALPECATQQVCNAVYTRLDRINALCACPEKFGDPCSISFSRDDAHTIELVTDSNSGKALTLIKTCEPIATVRECRGSKDWSLLALQNVRTGKSHYLVVCRCVNDAVLEGPIAHENPPYAKIPGIRVFGMVCIRELWSRNRSRERNKERVRRNAHNARMLRVLSRRNLPKLPLDTLHSFVNENHWK